MNVHLCIKCYQQHNNLETGSITVHNSTAIKVKSSIDINPAYYYYYHLTALCLGLPNFSVNKYHTGKKLSTHIN